MLELCLAILTFFAFANPIKQIPFFVFCFPLLLLYLANKSYNLIKLIIVSWIYGSFIYIFCLYWIYYPVSSYTNIPLIISIFCPVLLGLYLGLYPAVFSIFAFLVRKKHWLLQGIFCGLSWIVLEYIRSFFLTGFPWLNLTQAFTKYPIFIQLIQITGCIVYSGIIVCIITWIFNTRKKNLIPFTVGLISFIFILAINWHLYKRPIPKKEQIPSLIVQGNIDQYQKWNIKFQNSTLDKYINLTKSKLNPEIRLVVWPETAMVFYLYYNQFLTNKLLNFTRDKNFLLITGAPAYEKIKNKDRFFNRAYLISHGKIQDFYDKVHLVPFGEYVPLSNLLSFLEKIVEGPGNFSPGKALLPLRYRNIAICTLICYEIIFPDLTAEIVGKNAELIVNISNDAWFGNTSGPYQHLNQAILRAIETKRYILRATNSGVSAVISPKGEIIDKIGLNKEGSIYAESVYLIDQKTFFVLYHNHIKSFCFIIWIVLLICCFKKEIISQIGNRI